MGPIASQITSLTIVYSNLYSDADQRKHQSSVSLAFVWGIHQGLVNSPHKWPVTRKMFQFDDVIMFLDGHYRRQQTWYYMVCLKYICHHCQRFMRVGWLILIDIVSHNSLILDDINNVMFELSLIRAKGINSHIYISCGNASHKCVTENIIFTWDALTGDRWVKRAMIPSHEWVDNSMLVNIDTAANTWSEWQVFHQEWLVHVKLFKWVTYIHSVVTISPKFPLITTQWHGPVRSSFSCRLDVWRLRAVRLAR